MQEGDFLAVYGLLRQGEVGFEKFELARHFERAGPCLISGELYNVGDYPALIQGSGTVQGDLLRLLSPAVVSELDAYENYDPKDETGSLYLRRKVNLIEPNQTAWVYFWNRSVAELTAIQSGDWLARKAPS